MSHCIALRQTSTGEIRVSENDYTFVPHAWQRRNGNFGCDCNRGALFAQLGGMDTDELTDEEDDALFPCGYEAYEIVYYEVEGRRTEGEP